VLPLLGAKSCARDDREAAPGLLARKLMARELLNCAYRFGECVKLSKSRGIWKHAGAGDVIVEEPAGADARGYEFKRVTDILKSGFQIRDLAGSVKGVGLSLMAG
jgi:hypothetical protein